MKQLAAIYQIKDLSKFSGLVGRKTVTEVFCNQEFACQNE